MEKIEKNPELIIHISGKDNKLKEFIVNYVGEKTNPEEEEVTVEMILDVFATDFPEFFRVTSGPKKIENALKLLYQAIYNISKQLHIKNRLGCYKPYPCKLYKTEHCQ